MSVKTRLTKLLSTQATAYKQFADMFDLVYFGKIHHEDEEQRLVRGVTVSKQHIDEHYCVGTVHGYDIVLLKRSDSIQAPSSTKPEKYSWSIMQFDLHSNFHYPHVFIDGNHHNEAFYQALFIKFARLMRLDKSYLGDQVPTFIQKFTAYTPPDSLDDLPEVLVSASIGETMAHHFSHLDFEWYQDKLIVYSTGRPATKHMLEHMLRAGLWLATELDKIGAKKISALNRTDTDDSQLD